MMHIVGRVNWMLCCVLGLLLSASSASAAGYAEIGDAGDLPGSAQDTVGPPGSLDFISGTIFTSLDKDMYKIEITDPAGFSANVIVGGSLLDTQLFLFDSAGIGVYGNDDPSAAIQRSNLPVAHAEGPVSSGIYHLVISGPDNDPTTGGVEIFDDVNPGVQTAAGGVVDGWSPTFSVFGGTYQIDLTGAEFSNSTGGGVLPALGVFGLALVAGVLGVQGWRRLRS